jgi:hypothetical protein
MKFGSPCLDGRGRWGGQVAAALECLHAGGLVHNGVRLSSLQLDDRGDAVLGELGAAVGHHIQKMMMMMTMMTTMMMMMMMMMMVMMMMMMMMMLIMMMMTDSGG